MPIQAALHEASPSSTDATTRSPAATGDASAEKRKQPSDSKVIAPASALRNSLQEEQQPAKKQRVHGAESSNEGKGELFARSLLIFLADEKSVASTLPVTYNSVPEVPVFLAPCGRGGGKLDRFVLNVFDTPNHRRCWILFDAQSSETLPKKMPPAAYQDWQYQRFGGTEKPDITVFASDKAVFDKGPEIKLQLSCDRRGAAVVLLPPKDKLTEAAFVVYCTRATSGVFTTLRSGGLSIVATVYNEFASCNGMLLSSAMG